MRILIPLAAAVVCVLPAAAEPIVARFDTTYRVGNIQDINPAFPPVVIEFYIDRWDTTDGQMSPAIYQDDGTECFQPGDEPDRVSSITLEASPGSTVEGDRYDYGDLLPGAVVGDGFGGWGTANGFYCVGGSSTGAEQISWTPILVEMNSFCSLCPINSRFGDRPAPYGVSYIPLRYRPLESDGPWTYGWAAFQIEAVLQVEGPNCFPYACQDGPVPYDSLGYIGVSFESEPGVPTIIGAGLCPADLAADAVLDLADIQAFVTAFSAGEPDADFDDNSVYDLADLQLFVEAFTAGCDGILPQ